MFWNQSEQWTLHVGSFSDSQAPQAETNRPRKGMKRPGSSLSTSSNQSVSTFLDAAGHVGRTCIPATAGTASVLQSS